MLALPSASPAAPQSVAAAAAVNAGAGAGAGAASLAIKAEPGAAGDGQKKQAKVAKGQDSELPPPLKKSIQGALTIRKAVDSDKRVLKVTEATQFIAGM